VHWCEVHNISYTVTPCVLCSSSGGTVFQRVIFGFGVFAWCARWIYRWHFGNHCGSRLYWSWVRTLIIKGEGYEWSLQCAASTSESLRAVSAGEVCVRGETDPSERWRVWEEALVIRCKCRCEGGWVDELLDWDSGMGGEVVEHEFFIEHGYLGQIWPSYKHFWSSLCQKVVHTSW
jgi:hypothetical protein